MEGCERFEAALYGVSGRIQSILNLLPNMVKANAEEIRLRRKLPVALTVNGDTVFIEQNGNVSFSYNNSLAVANDSDLEESFRLLCGNSAFAHTEELKEGYIIMKNGGRAGICGTATDSGFMKNITSINIRIAREIKGCANEIAESFSGEGLLIAGAPGCGKTTVLRDLIRQLAGGKTGKYYRTAVIDSRGEISGSFKGASVNDLGYTTDLLYLRDRAKGMEIALRTMFPEIIAFDEIGTLEELNKVKQSFFSGVSVITTAHIGSEAELLSRNITGELIKSGLVTKVALLPRLHGGRIRIISSKELYDRAAI